MNISVVSSKVFAAIALAILLYGFIVPSVGFHGTLERIKDGEIDHIPSYVYPLWNFYQKGRYIGVSTPKEARLNLKKMVKTSEEIGAASFPVWSFSLEAPNYPKEAFPRGLPVFIHFDGLSGEVHEMNTINHYVGMAPMERGGPYERALAPYSLIMLALLLVSFILYDNKWINRLMVLPILLPFLFIGIYFYWLYWFGHNLHMGAIKIEPFMPVILGDGKVAQFTTHAYPAIGFWLLAAISLFSFFAWWLKRRGTKEQPTKRVMLMNHLLMVAVLLMGVGGYVYLVKIDREVDTLGKIADIIEKFKVKVPLEAKVPEPSKMEKEAIRNEMAEQRKDQELKLKALEKRVGRVTKFKVSALYKNSCSPCHGASGEGNIGSRLAGLSKDDVLKKMLDYKKNEETMHIAVIEHMSDDDLQKLAQEISEFKLEGRK
jgi:cytochrome c553